MFNKKLFDVINDVITPKIQFTMPISGAVEDLTTTETDTSLVLTPDGVGGTVWGAQISGGNDPLLNVIDDPVGATGVRIADVVNNVSTGANSLAIGSYTTATGNKSHSEGWGTTASGAQSHSEGKDTISSNSGSHAEGWTTTASGTYSHSEGKDTTASGIGSHAEGISSVASGSYAHASGKDSHATLYSQYAHGGGRFSGATAGALQYTRFCMRYDSFNATPTVMTLPATFPIDTNKTYGFTITIVARQQDGSNNAMYKRMCIIENTGGSTSLVGSVQTIGTDIESTPWDIGISTAGGLLNITITGVGPTLIRWSAIVEANEVWNNL